MSVMNLFVCLLQVFYIYSVVKAMDSHMGNCRESLVASRRASDQNCSEIPEQVPAYMSEPLKNEN